MTPNDLSALESGLRINRRHFFGRNATGIGTAALASLLNREGLLGASNHNPPDRGLTGLPDLPHHAAKAKRIIYLFQNGAPTHVDLFDHKPGITPLHGQPVPESYFKGKRFSTMTGDPSGKLMLSPVEPFKQRGQSGSWVS